jgi:hypothetical protein
MRRQVKRIVCAAVLPFAFWNGHVWAQCFYGGAITCSESTSHSGGAVLAVGVAGSYAITGAATGGSTLYEEEGVQGVASGYQGVGVYGAASSTSSTSYSQGVQGTTASPKGSGVYGQAESLKGPSIGVLGNAEGCYETAGVEGNATSRSGSAVGVYGASYAASGAGVYGASTNIAYGVLANSSAVALQATTNSASFCAIVETNLPGSSISTTGISTFGTVELDGPVGVNMGASPYYTLEVNDSSSLPSYCQGGWKTLSDRRLKINIEPLHDSLDSILRLRGVTYQWRDPDRHGGDTDVRRGFIAQEVEQVLPQWVTTNGEGYKQLMLIGFPALLVESVRELVNENHLLEEIAGRLEAEVGRLELAPPATSASMFAADDNALRHASLALVGLLAGLALSGHRRGRSRHTVTSSGQGGRS